MPQFFYTILIKHNFGTETYLDRYPARVQGTNAAGEEPVIAGPFDTWDECKAHAEYAAEDYPPGANWSLLEILYGADADELRTHASERQQLLAALES